MSFPVWQVKKWGAELNWTCQDCGKKWSEGWLMEGHHILPSSAGGKNVRSNFRLLCIHCHYLAHVELRKQGIDHPRSADLVLARFKRTQGRTRWYLKGERKTP